MNITNFISVGENIHCTRIFKVGGTTCKQMPDGTFGIEYKTVQKETRILQVPESFTKTPEWESGKVKHCAVAIWQAMNGDKKSGVDYLQQLAISQEKNGATYLDLNVDEYSTDIEEKKHIMKWLVETVQNSVKIPVSIDSSNEAILEAGLSATDKKRGRPMVNSVSLERKNAVEIAAKYNAVVIASAAGEKGLPETPEERVANIDAIIDILRRKNFALGDIHVDPLVFPISVNPMNGKMFLDTISVVRKKYGKEMHIVAGLSNISFGMPNRKLINQVFTILALENGADGGIVDPSQINTKILASFDKSSEAFTLARELLLGNDEYGMNFITAAREGKI